MVHEMFVAANIEKGRLALANHQTEQAEQAFQQAMQYPDDLGTGEPSQPDLAEQLYWLGTAFQAEGKTAQAISAWQESAAQTEQKSDTSVVFSALAFKSLGKSAQAQSILAQCIQAATQPDAEANSFYIAGLAEQFSGNAELAANDFHHALQLDPLLWQARVALNNMGSS